MTAYALAQLRSVAFGPEIVAYLEAIDATLAPFGGRFLIPGAAPRVLEGAWQGDLVVIAFPDLAAAAAWYESAAYRSILGLRRRNAEGPVILVEGVGPAHRATDILPPGRRSPPSGQMPR